MIGPAPLRFRPEKPPARVVSWPPLAMEEPAKPITAPHTAAARPALTTLTNGVTRRLNSAPASPILTGPSNQVVSVSSEPTPRSEDTNATSIITPQMLLQFFKANTNHGVGSFEAWPVFIPPVPANPPGSAAGYQRP